MLRSEEMCSIALYLNGNGIRSTMDDLGRMDIIQIKKNPVKKSQTENVSLKNAERVEQQLAYLKIGAFNEKAAEMSFDQAAAEITKSYKKMVDLRHNEKDLRAKKAHLEEEYLMAKEAYHFVEDVNRGKSIRFVTCIVERDKKFLIKKVLRTTMKRNCYVKMVDVESKYGTIPLSVFIVYVYGDDPERRAKEVIRTMGGRILETEKETRTLHGILETKRALREIGRSHREMKKEIAVNEGCLREKYKGWLQTVSKERRICEAINSLESSKAVSFESVDDVRDVYYTGEAWIRAADLGRLKAATSRRTRGFYCEEIKTRADETVPTHFRLNEFTRGFQNITNVFGIPKYQEINPAIFMVFTFPFMFGAMFGDVCHGLILLFISSYMIRNFNAYDHNCGVFQILLEGRYIVLCCSLATIWFGLLYGDFAGTSIALFRSQFETGRTYPFGIDPIWHHAENSMTFTNSLKMKMSLIIGFIHMSTGSVISLLNARHFQDTLTFYAVALPQFIAFGLFLGYLVFLCLYKWLVTVDHPSLVEVLIGMYTDPFNNTNQMYSGQLYVQLFILAVILLCVPWMFFSKPLFSILRHRVKGDQILDLWINSGIHTIEFGLGLISNTSSYLRLWAVSLAHVQLTGVLHQFTIGAGGIFYKVAIAPVYALATLLLLIGLEGLSSCLHALRLNWIEFFSKFYTGGGEKFDPLGFELTYDEIHDE
ncbi:VPP1 [Enterospora canceri]|uniref:V-type proton ATPase subunit a n=1 Tax=Enterospora canceri TaxID=1081671 RepID=A0A1Y1S974_9MICR|nr:VPP1 [Enterospora canceri]